MPVVRLTQEVAERARPGEMLCDDKVTGLLLISQKRVKTWCVQREVKDPETGIRKTARLKLGHFPEVTVQEARDRAKEELLKMEKGRNPHAMKQTDLTLRKATEEFLAGAVTLQPRTISGYRYNLDHYFAYKKEDGAVVDVGNVPLSELGKKPGIVKNLYVWLTKEKGKATALGTMRTISTVYSTARELNEELPPNPVLRRKVIILHKLPKRRTRIAEENFAAWGAKLQTILNPVRRALRLFLLLTGQRDEATRRMMWKHVDLRPGKESIHYPDPKGGPEAAFDLPLSPQVVEVLKFVRTFSEEGWAYGGSEWVWPTKDNSDAIVHIKETKEPNRKELLNPHALRRTFISEGYEVAPAKQVSYIVNHSCKDTQTDDYFVPSAESVRRALTTIDQSILDKIGIDLDKLLGPKVFTSTQFQATSKE